MPQKIRIALLGYQDSSIWMSCQKINAFLIKMYKKLYAKEDLYLINLSGDHYENLKAAQLIKDKKISHIIFYDHRLNPNFILAPLVANKNEINHLKITIHMYGHPFEKIEWWSNAFSQLQKNRIQLITSSHDMSKIAQKMFKNPPVIYVCPFGVTNKFKFAPTTRAIYRKKLKLNKEQKVFLYTGRISPGKNIHLIFKLFEKIMVNNDKLILVGPFDNYNKISNDDYQSYIANLIQALDPNKKKILWFPKSSEEELIKFYHISDCFINLSTMPGDDFGMSVAEAASNGLPILLTNWAGHKDHLPHIRGVKQLSVLKKEDDQILKSHDLKNFLCSDNNEDRTKRSRTNLAHYSFKNLVKYYEKNINFSHFTLDKKVILKELISTNNKLVYEDELYS